MLLLADLNAAVGWITAGMILFIVALERLKPRFREQRFLRSQLFADVFYTVFSLYLLWYLLEAMEGMTTVDDRVIASTVPFVKEKLGMGWDLSPVRSRYAWILLLLYQELWVYWIHRCLHRFGPLWKLHKLHHTSLELDVFNASRAHLLEVVLYPAILYLPMMLIGFSASAFFLAYVIGTLFSLLTHANFVLPLGPLKYVFNSPQMHLWHHHRDPRIKHGANFGNALIVWDYVFGTAYPHKDGQEVRVGLDLEDQSHFPRTLWRQFLWPFSKPKS